LSQTVANRSESFPGTVERWLNNPSSRPFPVLRGEASAAQQAQIAMTINVQVTVDVSGCELFPLR
jgi:hypothetical protein